VRFARFMATGLYGVGIGVFVVVASVAPFVKPMMPSFGGSFAARRILRTGRVGDHYVEAKVILPKKMNRKQRELFEQFAAALGLEAPPK